MELARDERSTVRPAAIAALTRLDLGVAASAAATYLSRAGTTADDVAPVFEAFEGRKGGAVALAKEIDRISLTPDVAKIGLRVDGVSGRPEPKLVPGVKSRW